MRTRSFLRLLFLGMAAGTLALACKSDGGMTPPTLTPTQLVKVSGDGQTGIVGQALAQAIVARVDDQFGDPMAGVSVNFAAAAGNGSLAAASGTTDANGRVSNDWTLGTGSGGQQVTLTVAGSNLTGTFDATANPDVPATLVEVSGNNQSAPHDGTLAPVVVRVADQYGNGVPGVDVAFTVTSGGGAVVPDVATTDANGEASTVWTLGSTVGQQTIEATLATPLVTLQFVADALDFFITSVAPDTLVEGQAATIIGDGFDDTTPSNNVVRVGGRNATVASATQTTLSITVPAFDCRPARNVNVVVMLAGQSTNTVSHPVQPASFLNLGVGEVALLQDPADFCLQFRPSLTGDEYILGVGAAAETPSTTVPFTMTAVTGATLPAPPVLPAPRSNVGATVALPDAQTLERWEARLRAESKLREWERTHLAGVPGRKQTVRRAPGAAAAVPNVGDMIDFRVPDADGPNACDFTQITTEVRVVGQAGVFVTDINNPITDSLTLAELQAYSDTFDVDIYDVDTTYFGVPSDLDDNQRVFIVLTIEVNKFAGIAGFVFSGDLVDRSFCAASDTGEIFYGQVPDPNNASGTGARTKANVLGQMASLIAHEFTHNIQTSRRVVLNSGVNLTRWEAEGQATLAQEVVGHQILGNSPRQNYDANVAFGAGTGDQWYQQEFLLLARYFGQLPSSSKATDAPELCTLFGQSTAPAGIPCDFFHFYGSAWSFQRFVADQFGPGYTGGEAAVHRDWIGANPSLAGVANIEALLGVQFDSVFARWGASLYADDRGGNASVSMLSWNLPDVFAAFVSDDFRLLPVDRGFAAFSDSRSVRGGSHAYTRLSAVAARPALALRVRDDGDQVLGTSMRPQYWIVRLQ